MAFFLWRGGFVRTAADRTRTLWFVVCCGASGDWGMLLPWPGVSGDWHTLLLQPRVDDADRLGCTRLVMPFRDGADSYAWPRNFSLSGLPGGIAAGEPDGRAKPPAAVEMKGRRCRCVHPVRLSVARRYAVSADRFPDRSRSLRTLPCRGLPAGSNRPVRARYTR